MKQKTHNKSKQPEKSTDSLLDQEKNVQDNQHSSNEEKSIIFETDAYTLIKATLWQSSYPSPEDMKKYAEIYPDSAEILFTEYQNTK